MRTLLTFLLALLLPIQWSVAAIAAPCARDVVAPAAGAPERAHRAADGRDARHVQAGFRAVHSGEAHVPGQGAPDRAARPAHAHAEHPAHGLRHADAAHHAHQGHHAHLGQHVHHADRANPAHAVPHADAPPASSPDAGPAG
ncbi:MAG TPA: hypothetical protein VEA81_17505, partial [Burkholderiaceae bacterium]|nr:hypothetical protein [Burkholderiaceae bacterium]